MPSALSVVIFVDVALIVAKWDQENKTFTLAKTVCKKESQLLAFCRI